MLEHLTTIRWCEVVSKFVYEQKVFMLISVNQLGLAAYIKMKGSDLVEVVGKTFVFESLKSVNEWRVEYNNSCCIQHDIWVCELRNHLRYE